MLNVLSLRYYPFEIIRSDFWNTSAYSEEISSSTMDAPEFIPSGAVTAITLIGETRGYSGVPRGEPFWNLPLEKDEVKKKGGFRENAGRKPLADVPSVVLTVRVTPQQKRAFQSKGGASWLRDQLDLFD